MNRNVEPKREIEPPAELESQCILRLPPEPAKVLREVIRSGSMGLKERFSIKLENDMRYGEVRLDHWLMPAKVVDFPTILESLKTIDGKSFYKTADVCQLVICKEEDDEEKGKDGPDGDAAGEAASSKGKKKDPNKVDRKFLWPHGLTPPMKNVRKRRFRKTLKKKYVEAPEIEKEVKRLLRVDNDAVSVKWEIIANEDEAESGVGGGNSEVNGTALTTNDVVPATTDKDDTEEPESRDGNASGISLNGNAGIRGRDTNGVAARFRGNRAGTAIGVAVKMEGEDGPSLEEDTEDRRKDGDTSLETTNQHSMDVAEDDIFGGAVSDSEEEGMEEEKVIGMEGRRAHLEIDDDEEEEDDEDEEGGNTLLDDIEEEGASRLSAMDSRNSDSTFGTDSMQQNTRSSPLPLVTQFTKEMFSPSRVGRDDLFEKNTAGTSSESIRRDLMSSPKSKSKEIKTTSSGSPAKSMSKGSLVLHLSTLGRELEELSKKLQAAQEAEASAPENQALKQRFARITDSLLEQHALKKQEYEEVQLLLQST